MKQLLEKVHLNSCTLSIFPAFEMKKLVLVGKIPWHFDTYMVNSLVNSDIPVMFNIYEMIKIMHEKTLSAIYL